MKEKHAHGCLRRLKRQRAGNVQNGVKESTPVHDILLSRFTKVSWPLPAKLQWDLPCLTERSAN